MAAMLGRVNKDDVTKTRPQGMEEFLEAEKSSKSVPGKGKKGKKEGFGQCA